MAKDKLVRWPWNDGGRLSSRYFIDRDPRIDPALCPRILGLIRDAVLRNQEWGAGHGDAPEILENQIARVMAVLYGSTLEEEQEEERRHEAEYRARCRAKEKRPIPQRLRTAVFERDAYRCRRCGSHVGLCADHIIPECRGGPTALDNLQTLCRPCNTAKGARLED